MIDNKIIYLKLFNIEVCLLKNKRKIIYDINIFTCNFYMRFVKLYNYIILHLSCFFIIIII